MVNGTGSHSQVPRFSIYFTLRNPKKDIELNKKPIPSIISFFSLWRCDPTRDMASSFSRFLDHTQQHTTVGRTSLDEWSARRRDLYLTAHNAHNRQTFMPPRWDSNPRSQQASGLRPLACWDRGYESHRGHGHLSVVSVVCCQVEVSATSWSLVQRSPTDSAASLCVI